MRRGDDNGNRTCLMPGLSRSGGGTHWRRAIERAGGLYVRRIVVGRTIRYLSLMLMAWGALMIKKLIELSRALKSKFSVIFNFSSLFMSQ